MNKNLSRYRANIPRIPYAKTPIHKISLDLSIPGTKKIALKNKNDSINKETVDGSCIDAQTLAFNQESLNNSKMTIIKNNSIGKFDNKLLVFTSSLNYSLNKRNKSYNFLKNIQTKTYEQSSENISSSIENENVISMENIYNDEEDEDTNKIDYRYYPKIPEIEGNKDKNIQYYWLATYDKLMKKSKIIKILNYYTDSLSHKESEIFIIEDANSDYNEEESKERLKKMNEKYNFKEKTMIVQGYEIYFIKKHGKPFIRRRKGGKLFLKLYLLNLEQINQIFSYINRLEYKQYINHFHLYSFIQRNTVKRINNFNKSIYNYSTIFCLGAFMNINIYLFSQTPKKNEEDINEYYRYNVNDLPSTNKIAKIVKALLMNFPDFSKQYFIDYVMKPKEANIELDVHDIKILQQKISEVNLLLMTNKKNNNKVNNNTKNVISNIIKGIQTYTPSSFCTPNNIKGYSKSQNTSALNILDKNISNYHNNNLNNQQMNCSDFLSNIKSELDGIANISYQKINNNEFKQSMSKPLNKIKLNNMNYTRNNNINSLIKTNNSNKFPIQTVYNLKGSINNNQNIFKTILLTNPIKKSLTRNNSNNFIHYKKTKNNKTKKNLNKKTTQQNSDIKDKENANILNKNLIKEYNINNNSNETFINNIFIKSDSGNTYKVTRNKNSIYWSYFTNNTKTNINNTDKLKYKRKNKDIKLKNPVSVISTIKKVISQKIKNLSENNTNSFIKFNKIGSNSSLLKEIKNNYYFNDNSNSQNKCNRILCKVNNNSQNKKSEYITPIKKRFFYYYH